jgi:hypothetical protein
MTNSTDENKLEEKTEKEQVCFCGKPAEYVRYTQFAGDHYFCGECAKKEEDFMKDGGSYFVWGKIKEDKEE